MPNGSTRLLLADSNLLVYAVDRAEEDKSIRASEVIEAIDQAERGITNSQVMIEFYATSTRPHGSRPSLLRPDEAQLWIERWLTIFSFRPITEAVFREAVRGSHTYQMNIFDAQIWAAARLCGALYILTEDTQSRDVIEGIEYVNPLDPAFSFEQIGL